MKRQKNNSLFDRLGIFCSGICFTHCMLLPFLVFLFPSFSFLEDNSSTHIAIFLLVITIALISFRKSKGQSIKPLVFGRLGVLILGAALFLAYFDKDHSHHEEFWHPDTILSMAGSIFLIIGHFLNMKMKACCHQHDHTLENKK